MKPLGPKIVTVLRNCAIHNRLLNSLKSCKLITLRACQSKDRKWAILGKEVRGTELTTLEHEKATFNVKAEFEMRARVSREVIKMIP